MVVTKILGKPKESITGILQTKQSEACGRVLCRLQPLLTPYLYMSIVE